MSFRRARRHKAPTGGAWSVNTGGEHSVAFVALANAQHTFVNFIANHAADKVTGHAPEKGTTDAADRKADGPSGSAEGGAGAGALKQARHSESCTGQATDGRAGLAALGDGVRVCRAAVRAFEFHHDFSIRFAQEARWVDTDVIKPRKPIGWRGFGRSEGVKRPQFEQAISSS
jgi:hypothetical protein